MRQDRSHISEKQLITIGKDFGGRGVGGTDNELNL